MTAEQAFLFIRDNAVYVRISLVPGAKKSRIVGPYGNSLKVAVVAPATQGRANEALVDLLAEILSCPRNIISIEIGHTSRKKLVMVEGLSLEYCIDRLLIKT